MPWQSGAGIHRCVEIGGKKGGGGTKENKEPTMEKAATVPPTNRRTGRKTVRAVTPATVATAKPAAPAARASTRGPGIQLAGSHANRIRFGCVGIACIL